MAIGAAASSRPKESFDQYVDRCLSLILHHEGIERIALVIKQVHRERGQRIRETEAGDHGPT